MVSFILDFGFGAPGRRVTEDAVFLDSTIIRFSFFCRPRFLPVFEAKATPPVDGKSIPFTQRKRRPSRSLPVRPPLLCRQPAEWLSGLEVELGAAFSRFFLCLHGFRFTAHRRQFTSEKPKLRQGRGHFSLSPHPSGTIPGEPHSDAWRAQDSLARRGPPKTHVTPCECVEKLCQFSIGLYPRPHQRWEEENRDPIKPSSRINHHGSRAHCFLLAVASAGGVAAALSWSIFLSPSFFSSMGSHA